jgi:hypothetical protein
LFSPEMDMNTPEPAKALAARTGALEVRDEDPLGVSDDDVGHHPAPIDKEGDLTAELRGELAKGSSRLPGDHSLGGDFTPVKVFQTFELVGLKPGEMAVDLADG